MRFSLVNQKKKNPKKERKMRDMEQNEDMLER